jgi:sugar phosphate permease
MDYGTRKAASSATGFIDGVGYIGAAVTGILSGWLTDARGWDAAFYLWIAGAIVAGVLMLLLWNYFIRRRKGNMSETMVYLGICPLAFNPWPFIY